MTNLKNYLQDGANYQARATLMFLQGFADIEGSWNEERLTYDAEIKVARWENCREQGYIVSLISKNFEQINIAFFEHRNSDKIHAVKWNQSSMNTITIETAKFDNVYKDKFDTSYSVEFGNALEMARWISVELTIFWNENKD